MRTVAVSLALGLGLVAFGASDAKAFCIDFSNRCDCLTVDGRLSDINRGQVRRLFGTWVNQQVNQDCGGRSSPVQGLNFEKASLAGELTAMTGVSWNFTFVNLVGECAFELDLYKVELRGMPPRKIRTNQPCKVIETGPDGCPEDCSAALKPYGLPPSTLE